MGGARGRIGGWLEALLAQGVTPAVTDTVEKRIRISNAGSMFAMLALFVSVPFDLVEAPSWMVGLDVVGGLAFAGIVLLNRGGRFTAARLAFIVLANLLVLANALGLGADSGADMLFIALVALPFVFFDLADRSVIALGLALPVTGLVLGDLLFADPLYARPAGYSAGSYHLYSSIAAIAIVVFSFFQISRANARAERALRDDIAARERAESELAVSRQASITAAKLAALGEMSANVAHEVNNPLTAILVRAQRLEVLAGKHRLDGEAVLRASRQIGSTVDRIRRIIDALRFFARQGDDDPMRPERVRAIVNDTVELCAQRFRMAGIDLEVLHSDGEAHVECRGGQISQILLNLLSNAFDAVDGRAERRVRLAVATSELEVHIAVTDTGGGIPGEIAHRIMEPFFTTKEIGRGTGLGLSLSKGIAEAHGGQLALDPRSTETRFLLSLPRCAPPPEVGSTEAEVA